MASSLRFIASNVVTRSFHPTVISASRFLSVDRSYSTRPTVADLFCNQSWPRILCPAEISSMSFILKMTAEISSLELKINDDDIKLYLNLPGLKREDMTRACADQYKFVQHKTQLANKEDAMLSIIDNVVANFRDIHAKRCWPFSDMFSDRSIIGKEICPLMPMLSPLNAFSIFVSEIDRDELFTSMHFYEHEQVKLTKQGVRVSSYFHNKTYFDYDTLFFEDKYKGGRNITGIRLPEGMIRTNQMIKTKTVSGELSVFIPCVKKEIKIN